jgi:hypothetical protein
VADPRVVAPDCHSLAELAVESSDGKQIVEVGWTVDPAQFGDDYPQLFVFHWVNRVPSCYDGCGFVSTSAMAGEILEPGSSQTFEIEYVTNGWAIFDNNSEVGYFPGSLWPMGFSTVGLADWFGEVADGSQDAGRPCSQMGDGELPATGNSAEISGISFIGGPSELSLQTHVTSASYYDVALGSPGVMSFGGPGGCAG